MLAGTLAVTACAGHGGVGAPRAWPPHIPAPIAQELDTMLDRDLADALTCRVRDWPLELAARRPIYQCEAGDSAGPGRTAIALLSGDAQPLYVLESWRADTADEPRIWARMIAANDARWGKRQLCSAGSSIWLTPEWQVVATLYRYLEPNDDRVYQVSYVVTRRDRKTKIPRHTDDCKRDSTM